MSPRANLAPIVAQLDVLTPPQKLRLAADLMDAGRGNVAHVIAEGVVLELGAAIALRRLEARADPDASQVRGEGSTT